MVDTEVLVSIFIRTYTARLPCIAYSEKMGAICGDVTGYLDQILICYLAATFLQLKYKQKLLSFEVFFSSLESLLK